MFECHYCGQKFSRKYNLIRHLQKHETNLKKCQCQFCDKTFSRSDARNKHVRTCKSNPQAKRYSDIEERKRRSKMSEGPPIKKQRCKSCNIDVVSLHNHYRSEEHKQNQKTEEIDPWTDVVFTEFKSRIISYRLYSEKTHLTPQDFMDNVRERVRKLINAKLMELGSAVKVNLELFAEYAKYDGNGENITERATMSFNSKNKVISMEETDLEDIYNSFADKISTQADDFERKGSGWALIGTLRLELNINKFAPIKGSCYLPLPKWIQDKHACVNVQNEDNACFAWAVLSALHPPEKHTERVSKYRKYYDELNLDGIEFPMSLSGIKKFENQNDISINVFEISDSDEIILGPLYHTKKRRKTHINLLLVEDEVRYHYCWIKNMSRLVGSQVSKNKHRIYVCDGYLLQFVKLAKFNQHIKHDCSRVVTVLPTAGNKILQFKKWSHQIKAPVVVYADFEALIKPVQSCAPNITSSYTYNRFIHEPYSFGYYIQCSYDDSLSKYITYRGEKCTDIFFKSLKQELAPFVKKIKTEVGMIELTHEQKIIYESAEHCHICGKEFHTQNITQGDKKVRDHDHMTGEFRGAAHSRCNLNYKHDGIIPIVIHNLSGYDAHFIIKALQERDHVKVIAKNKENYISFTVQCRHLAIDLRFIDSLKFMSSSLSQLAKNLPQEQLKIIPKHFSHEKVKLISQKGVFPYEYTDSWKKLDEKCLPQKEAFYSSLKSSGITDEEYNHAQNVWKEFGIKTLGEYSDVYLKTDVLLLAEVFENFREVCLRTYNLDPANYHTAPGLSWDAMLKHTAIKLELVTDDAMVKFISRGIRGGLSQCSGQYARANNKDLDDYDSSQGSSYIVYLDANNLYGWAMSQHLPVGDFCWLSPEKVETFHEVLDTLQSEDPTGYILEVDLDYPPHLHDDHNDLPFCPENKIPDYSETNSKKLIADFHTKHKYVIHYRNLKQCLEHGLILKKIHRILSFRQSPWMKPYIDLNTRNRIAARDTFEKDFYKLMNNAVFGKTMENVEKYVDVRIVRSWESVGKRLGARALISRIHFHSVAKITKDMLIIQMKRNKITYNKPTYIGFSVLDISKTLMYEFHYDYMQNKYQDRLRLLYTDTDSLIYEIKTDDFYEDIRPDIDERFDTSNYPPDNRYGLPLKNKMVLGLMKDEVKGELISEFIGIRSKCYFVKRETEDIKRIKGIKTEIIKKDVSGDDFYNCISQPGSVQYKEMCTTRSHLHDIYTQMTNKIALRNSDDKRFAIPGKQYETLALGHKDIDQYRASTSNGVDEI